MLTRPLKKFALLTLLLLPASAFAHAGGGAHTHFAAGSLHPFAGVDHLLAMFAVGLWSMQLRSRHALCVPLAFVSMMLVGFVAGMQGIVIAGLENGIAFSVLMFGLLLTARIRVPVMAGAILCGSFAFLHGMAHGMEINGNANAFSFGCGMILSTLMLHAVGMITGMVLRNRRETLVISTLGTGILAGGLWLLLN